MKNLKNLFLGLGLILLSACGSGDDATPDKYDAEIEVQYHVQEQLKSPSTAEFGLAEVTDKGNGEFFVQNYVDSENGFGANIRTNYSCTIEFTSGGDKFKIHDLIFF